MLKTVCILKEIVCTIKSETVRKEMLKKYRLKALLTWEREN